MGKKHADEMLFWTRQEFQTFIEVMKDRPASYAVFMTLYFTGIREGELLALTPSDIDFEKKTPDGKQELSASRQRGHRHHAENAQEQPHHLHSRRSLHLFTGVYVPLLRAAKGRQALSLHQELSIPRNGVWLQGFGREADTGA